MKKYFILILIASLFASCEPPFTFKEPQPTDSKNLTKFPKKIQGKYLNIEDSTFLQITENSIIKIYDIDFASSIKDLESNYIIKNDTLIDTLNNDKIFVKIYNDSIYAHIYQEFIVFKISDENILRKMKGYFFLNDKYNDNQWEVKKIFYKNKNLEINSINSEEDLSNFAKENISETDTIETIVYIPTRKQFRNFIISDSFNDKVKLKKIYNR